jgi:hypothetical protein
VQDTHEISESGSGERRSKIDFFFLTVICESADDTPSSVTGRRVTGGVTQSVKDTSEQVDGTHGCREDGSEETCGYEVVIAVSLGEDNNIT